MALGKDTFTGIGGAVSDLYAASGHKVKAEGNRLEAKNYLAAADYADKNAVYTEMSTAIKVQQADRDLFQSMGQTRADVASAGFQESGSALDILRDSAAQGALTKHVITEQGLITEEGYRVQAQSFRTMAEAANMAASADERAAEGAYISSGIKVAGSIASLFTG